MTRVVVAGRDAPLWLAALALRRALAPAGIEVTAVELPTALAPAEAYSALPAIEALHARIGIDETALLRATGGVFSHGTNITGDGAPAFFLGHGSHGAPVGAAPFFPTWVMAHHHGLHARLQDFSLVAAAALNGRLMLADEASAGFGRADYGYALPARAYVGVLKGIAPRLGIATHRSTTVGVDRRTDGMIAALLLDDDHRIEGGLFIDATGPDALLATALGGTRDDWRAAFPADRRLIARAPALAAIPAYAEMRIQPTGWTRLQATHAGMTVTHAFAADLMSDDAALRAIGMPLTDIAFVASRPGRLRAPWQGNCVAIGGAACAVDPVLGMDLHVAQLGIVHLLSLFPAGAMIAAAECDEYNRLMASSLDRVRDAQAAMYALAPWPGASWDRARAAPASATLAQLVATFRARGEVAPFEDETLDPAEWQALLVGLGVMPESWPPAIDRLDGDTIKTAFRGMLGYVRDTVLAQPTHDRYLADTVGAA